MGYRIAASGEHAKAEVCACTASCPTCGGTRYVLLVEGGYEVAAPCACAAFHERIRLFNAAGVPAGYATKSTSNFRDLDNPSLKVAKQLFMSYQRSLEARATRGVVLIGPPGVGKTHLICALLNYATLQRGVASRFVDFFALTSRIRETFGQRERGETEGTLIEALVEVPVLAIDDLGKGRGSNWELTIIDQLITRRYNAGRVVIATSNFYPQGQDPAAANAANFTATGRRRDVREPLEERIGERLYSRLVEMSDVVVLQGKDQRRRGGRRRRGRGPGGG